MSKYILTTLLICSCFIGFGQNRLRYLPDDLPESKIILLQHVPYNTDSIEGIYGYMIKKRNAMIIKSNKMLEEEAKNYPFEYVICTRDQVPFYYTQGYKYVLDCPFFSAIQNGEGLYAGYRKKYEAEIYILNLESKDWHPLFKFSQTFMFSYDKIMKKVNKKVRKYYKVKN